MVTKRTGFTLIELLVVIALIAIVATLAVLFFPGAATSAREANAAQQLQGWLNTAKQRALRNQRPSGLRLYVAQGYQVNENTFNNVVVECQYIEAPDDYGNPLFPIQSITQAMGLTWINPAWKAANIYDVLWIQGDVTNGYGTKFYDYTKHGALSVNLPKGLPGAGLKTYNNGATTYAYDPNQQYWTVQPCPFITSGKGFYPYVPDPQGYGGDSIEVYGNGIMHKVIAVLCAQPTGLPATMPQIGSIVQIWPPLSTPIVSPTTSYRIVRSPRVLGSETLQLPDFTFIDLNTNVLYNNPLPGLMTATANTGIAEKSVNDAGAANSGADLTATGAMTTTPNFIDILFSPSGQVITPGVATANMNLWVRSPSEQAQLAQSTGAPNYNEMLGSPTIVSVFVRTGLVGAYPPVLPSAANGNDPYYWVR